MKIICVLSGRLCVCVFQLLAAVTIHLVCIPRCINISFSFLFLDHTKYLTCCDQILNNPVKLTNHSNQKFTHLIVNKVSPWGSRKLCFLWRTKPFFVGQTSETVNLQGGGRSQKYSVENYCRSMPQQQAKQTQVLVSGTAWIHTQNTICPTKGIIPDKKSNPHFLLRIFKKSQAFLWALCLERDVNAYSTIG